MFSPKETIKQPERPENYEVVLDINLSRHGKKASFNATNIEDSEKIANLAKIEDLQDYDLVAVRTTPVERAVRTGLKYQEGFSENKTYAQEAKVNIRINEDISPIKSKGGKNIKEITKETEESKDINLLTEDFRKKYREAIEQDEFSSFDKENAGVLAWTEQMFEEMISLKQTFQDLSESKNLSELAKEEIKEFREKQLQSGGISILENSLKMTEQLNHYIKASDRYTKSSKILIQEINHAGFIEPFLIYLLKDDLEKKPINSEGKDIVEKIGGAFEPNETVKISIKRKKDSKKELNQLAIVIQLRNQEYVLHINEVENNIFKVSEKLLKEIGISDLILQKKINNS
ncbi:MAG: hypothetical protein MUF50_02545 [Planctomycetes bacterium]|jgi:hypothetical protein|nr:hypothetical protein [Planctomycetota bacterium]